jgi:tetratricopeptide (TPR) repeat protein
MDVALVEDVELTAEQLKQRDIHNQAIFQEGYELFSDKDYLEAAEVLYRFIERTDSDTENNDWAQFFVGISLEQLGYSQASVDTLSHLLKVKPNPKIVAYILEMFAAISRTDAFDRDLVLSEVLSNQDFAFVDDDIANFSHFYQGVNDWKNGLMTWGQEHFDKIDGNSYFYYKYLYHKGQYSLSQGDLQQAINDFSLILNMTNPDSKLLDLTRWTLARLLYEKGDYKTALRIYKKIKTPLVDNASFLLEQAWNTYRLGDAENAMGFLYAFEAPSFERFFTPEFYILKSFIYKDVCYYESAFSVVDQFQSRYGASLNAIYERKGAADPESFEILQVILMKESINRIWRFIQLLEKEQQKIHLIGSDPLTEYVNNIYQLQLQQSSKKLKNRVNDEFEKVANSLLKYQEEANLMQYEIGIDKYQRVANNHYQQQSEKVVGKKTGIVVFPFQGEFWNDEVGNYKVSLPSKCEESENWELFFK